MKLNELFAAIPIREAGAPYQKGQHDDEHQEALNQTGFWGKKGAGCLIMSLKTGRFLIAHRSDAVQEPNTWGTWGGAIDPSEDPAEAVKREVHEETGYTGPITVEPLFVFKSGSFAYYNFLVTIADEFKPVLDWENQGYEWCEFGQWPAPLHPGLKALLADGASIATMKNELAKVGTDQPAAGDNTVTVDSSSGVQEGLGAVLGGLIGSKKPRAVKMLKAKDNIIPVEVEGKGVYTVKKTVGAPTFRTPKYVDTFEVLNPNGRPVAEYASFAAVMEFLRTGALA